LKRQKILALLILGVIIAGLVIGCASPETPTTTPTTPTTPTTTPTTPTTTPTTPTTPAEAEMEIYKIKFHDYVSRDPNVWWQTEDLEKRLETASNGQLDITIYAAGEIVGSTELLSAVGAGTVDFARGMGMYWEEVELGPIEGGLPFSWASTDEAQTFYDEHYLNFEGLLREEYAELNAYHIGPSYEDPYCIVSTAPIVTIADLQKLKIRMLTGPAKVAAKVGGNGVYIPYEEVYLAISQGTIDGGLFGGAASYLDLSFPEIAPYYCKTPWVSPVTTSYIYNLDSWNALPDNLKQLISDEVMYQSLVIGRNYCMSGEMAAWDSFTTTELEPAAVAALTTAAIDVWNEYAAKSDRLNAAVELIKTLNRQAGRIE